jgi:protein-tyrosine phosphatase
LQRYIHNIFEEKKAVIDLHTHILPGIDDGAKDIDESLAMAQIGVNDGITIMVATPHVISREIDNRKQNILENVGYLNKCLEEAGIKLQILPGAEYRLEPDLPRRLAAGELLTINDTGRYLLVELPAAMVSDYTGRILYDLQLQGIIPIIAHPERNVGLERNPELLQGLVSRGILAQITSTSITGQFGKSVKKTAWKLLQEGSAHLIASDAHSSHGRSPVLSLAFQELENRWGKDYARTLTYDNPRLIIEGQSVEPCIPAKKEKSWTRFLKKSTNIYNLW